MQRKQTKSSIGGLLQTNKMTSPSWLVISGCRALQRYCRDHGFKSRTGLNFFSGFYFHYCFSNVHYREDHSHLHLLFRSSNKLYDFHMFIVLFSSCSIVLLHVRQMPINKFLKLNGHSLVVEICRQQPRINTDMNLNLLTLNLWDGHQSF